MFNIVRFTRRTCPALALTLALTSCDSSTNEALTSFLTGNSSQEHQQLQAQLQQMKNALAQTEQEISRNSMPCNINITRMRPNWLNSNKPTR